MKTTVYLVRHGNSTGNVRGQIIGTTDVSLTKVGLKQGREIAKYFKNKHIDAIYSSALSRAETTATYTAKLKKLPLKIDNRFAEFNFGEEYEGVFWRDALKRENSAYVKYREAEGFVTVKFPKGGECASDVIDRFIPALLDLEKNHKGQTVMVVTHSIALMTLFMYLKNGCTLEGAKRTDRLPNACINTIEIENGKIILVEEGYTDHLSGITV